MQDNIRMRSVLVDNLADLALDDSYYAPKAQNETDRNVHETKGKKLNGLSNLLIHRNHYLLLFMLLCCLNINQLINHYKIIRLLMCIQYWGLPIQY